MGTSGNTGKGVQGRSLQSAETLSEAQLREAVETLTAEVAALRAALAERGDAAVQLAQLREANQNLVLASISAADRRDEAEETNRRQNEFLAMLAHELRNPLAPISMAGTLLERLPDASPQLKNLQRIIGRQVEQMSRLLDDLLDAARISSGKITLTLEPVLLSDLVERAVETVAPRIAERRQALTVNIPDHPIVIEGNRVRLTQVFSNLLANASKYTQDGGAIVLGACDDGVKVRVALKDNGIGMAGDVLPHIFDLFTQGPRSLARSEGGLGVGLNVVRNVVQLHGGEVRASSAGLGLGSEFTVVLPMSRNTAEPRQAGGAGVARTARCRVLLVEDNVDACSTLHAFLESCGHAVRSVHDGADGLQEALHEDFDVLVCDIGLPGLDGYALIRQLRLARPGRRPYAVALSGYGQPEDQQLGRTAGFDEFLVKPVDAAALLALIEQACASPACIPAG